MALSKKFLKKQIAFFKPFADGCGVGISRAAQKRLGELMALGLRNDVSFTDCSFTDFKAAWIQPRKCKREGIILYLHGGGYIAGDLDYAKGCGALLAAKCNIKVFCAAYRLAPEFPFPAALEDALCAYRYLLKSGYDPAHIILAGESAGGGLCYALCLKLREQGRSLPAGILALSPWTDLTLSGESFIHNKEADPSLSKERLLQYAAHYTDHPENPLVSPLLADLSDMPPSLIFVGGDEILLDDARLLHEKLTKNNNESTLIIAEGLWHAYLLYGLKEREGDLQKMEEFLDTLLSDNAFKPRWLRLDNAAKIYPAARKRRWSNVFRLSVSFKEPIDPDILQSALEVTARRFPSISVRLRRGLFWYYLEQLPHAPAIQKDGPFPCMRMKKSAIRQCAFRVLYHENRIAAEFFHALTDGTGGLIFIKTLAAEYLEQKHQIEVRPADGVLDRLEAPKESELEDSFLKYAGDLNASRKEATAYRLKGTPEADGYRNLICGTMPVKEVLALAKKYDASLTCFIAAVLTEAIQELQQKEIPNRRRQKPVKILIPVNLRNLFPSESLRNFALYSTPAMDPRLGDHSFEDIIGIIKHHLALDVTPQQMSSKIATNVSSERSFIIRILPLFIKNIAMKTVYNIVGERKNCLSLSNLGRVLVPKEMEPFISRFDFILGTQALLPHNCGILSYGDTLYINFIRSIKEPELERLFFTKLRKMGIPIKIESNQR